MPDRRHHDPHVKRKLVGAALLKELALEEHAGSFAKLDNGASHAFRSIPKPMLCAWPMTVFTGWPRLSGQIT
jgi:hypothetical protein